MPRWAKLYDSCQSCGTEETRHAGKGLCASCYNAATEKRQKSHITRRIGTRLANPITKEELEQRYLSGQSLNDIARHYNCTRQYIHKLMRQYRFVRRSNQEARILSIEQGKVVYASEVHSPGSSIVLQRRMVDESFFKTWTPAMAWVLGVIYTDGNLHKTPGAVGRVSIAQKEPELLQKVLVLMKSNAKVSFSPKRGIAGALYTIRIHNAEIYADLQRLGLTPAKSLTLQFPDIPPDCVLHFVRGCWDGDGSVYVEKRNNIPCASYVSGSKDFIERLVGHLVNLGLPNRIIHKTVRSETPSYYFRYTRGQCTKLFHVLYDDVDASMYLSRKHDTFKGIADHWEFDSTRVRTHVIVERPVRKGNQEGAVANAAHIAELKNYTHEQD
jgi:LAGLIDADG-like domain